MPNKLSRIARVGDLLRLKQFLKPGSPAQDKEPFFAFYDPLEPSQIVALRAGTEVLAFSPGSRTYHRERAVYLTQAVDYATRRKLKDGRFVFFQDKPEELVIEKCQFPRGLVIQVLSESTL
ncbi:MAG: hypothetical protein P4L81_02320 [Candidatus Pacebacteria bacterium]|nr:hypothetical protein [Candidatus Paceibacterota bacterium]